MSTVAKKIIMGSGAVDVPSDDDFNTVGFLSHFDGANNGVNNVFDDGSTSNHTITAAGDVTQGSFSPFSRPDGEWGVSFDGTGDHIQMAASSDFQFGTGDYTVEMFVYHTSLSGQQTYFSDPNGNNAGVYFYKDSNNKLGLYYSGQIVTGSANVPANQWVHVAVCRGSGTSRLFLDGVLQGSASDTTNLTETAYSIGNSVGGNNEFIGCISQVRVVKGTAVYTSAFTPPTAPLTAITNTKLLTCQSNRFIDNSDSAHAITAAGNAEVTPFSPLATEVYDPAVNGGSAYFVGNDSTYMILPANSLNLGTNNFTLEGWVYTTSTAQQAMVGNLTAQHGYGSYLIILNDSYTTKKVRFYCKYNGGTTLDITEESGTLSVNSWNYIAVTRDGANLRIFINGIQAGSTNTALGSYTIDPPQGSGNTSAYLIGRTTDADSYSGSRMPFIGYLSSLRVVIGTAVYTSNFTPPTAPVTAITNTKLLLNMANAQAFDSAAQNNMTLYGNAKISTAQKKIGNSSLYLDGTGDYLTFPETPAGADIDFGTDWTVEFYFRPTQASIDSSLIEIVSKEAGFQLYMSAAEMGLAISANNSGSYIFNTVTGTDLSADTWYHIAAVHYGNTYKMYVDGTLTAINTTSTSNARTGAKWEIGGYIGGQYPTQGYIDEFRISKTARYTSNFTPSTEPFPDKGKS